MTTRLSASSALANHWREYLIEAWALGVFMVSAAAFTIALESKVSPLPTLISDANLRRALIGIAMGLTAICLIYSGWGQRSGAHMNPAVTLAYWSLGRVSTWDAMFYVLAQFVGGSIGVLLVYRLTDRVFAAPEVNFVATLPGRHGVGAAFVAELVISTLLMSVVLRVSGWTRWSRFTGVCAGILVALYITFEAPISGMSMNPARTFASAVVGGQWRAIWIYFCAPVIGMWLAARLYQRSRAPGTCAKLMHSPFRACIFCGQPGRVPAPQVSVRSVTHDH